MMDGNVQRASKCHTAGVPRDWSLFIETEANLGCFLVLGLQDWLRAGNSNFPGTESVESVRLNLHLKQFGLKMF